MPKAIIAPSLLASDFAVLANEAKNMLESGADWLHVDVMDGHFVPNLTLGSPIVASLRKHTEMYIDCHLMVSNPKQWAKAGANGFTFHFEALESTDSISDLIKQVKEAGMKVGIAIKPRTDVQLIESYCQDIDLVLIMTVEPGFGGQKKVKQIRAKYPNLNIQVDGGIKLDNIDQVAKSGANVIVSGTGIFGQKDPANIIQSMKLSIDSTI